MWLNRVKNETKLILWLRQAKAAGEVDWYKLNEADVDVWLQLLIHVLIPAYMLNTDTDTRGCMCEYLYLDTDAKKLTRRGILLSC